MIVFTNARNTTSQWPAWKADAKTKNFEKNPANGGIPASENKAMVITKLNLGFVLLKPL